MTEVTLQLAVSRGEQWSRDRSLWTRKVDLAFLPMPGIESEDLIELLDNDGWADFVYRRWWHHDGSVTLEFRKVIIDPDEDLAIERLRHVSTWHTERDGDLIARLRESGWSED